MGISGVSGGGGMHEQHPPMPINVLEAAINMLFENVNNEQHLKDVIAQLSKRSDLTPTQRHDLEQLLNDSEKYVQLYNEIQKLEKSGKDPAELQALENEMFWVKMDMTSLQQQFSG